MKKTISINLSGQNFLIEESAYAKLQNYLDEVRKHCGSNADVDEVMSDIESGIAEKLKNSLTQYKDVITEKDVESLIKIMGTVEDFDREVGDDGEEKKFEFKNIKHKLYRDMDDFILGGVSSGLGAYFDIDPVILRVLFVVLTFFHGFGILLYVILWIAMPEAKTASQKLEMHGERPTIAAFEKFSKNDKDVKLDLKERWKSFSLLGKICSAPFIAIGLLIDIAKKVFVKIWPVLKYVFGAFMIIVAIAGLILLGIGSLYLMLQVNSDYSISFIPVTELIKTLPFIPLIIGCFLFIAIPVALFLFGGLSIIRQKSVLSFSVGVILVAIWMIAGIFSIALGLRYLPSLKDKVENYPVLQNTSKDIDVSGVNGLVVSGNISVNVVSGTKTSAILSGRLVDIDSVDIKKENGILVLTEKDVKNSSCVLCDHRSVTLEISGDMLSKLNAEHGALINIKTNLQNSPKLIATDSSSIVWRNANAATLIATISDYSVIKIYGAVSDSSFELNNGDIKLINFSGQNVKINFEGANSKVYTDGSINKLDLLGNSVGDENAVDTYGAQIKKINADVSGKIILIVDDARDVIFGKNINAILYHSGQTNISGDNKNYKVLKYQKIDQSEFDEEGGAIYVNTENDGERTKMLFQSGDNYFVFNRGGFSSSEFSNMVNIFESEYRN